MSTSNVTSEALQLKLRQLLPSQQGFGTDLSASDTIIPIIDLTAAAEGSDVPSYLQTALAFGSQTVFQAQNNSVVVAQTPGFYRVTAFISMESNVTSSIPANFTLSDGVSSKEVFEALGVGGTAGVLSNFIDFNIFLTAGENCTAVSGSSDVFIRGSSRQIATANGVLVAPAGFNPQ